MRLARDRWYSREGQRNLQRRAHQESQGTRKIIGLVLLLLMILVVMRQLTDRTKYEPAFRAIGLTQSPSLNAPASKGENNRQEVTADSQTKGANSSSEVSTPDHPEDAKRALQKHFLIAESHNVEIFMQMWQRLFENTSAEVLSEFAKIEFSSEDRANTENRLESEKPEKLSTAALAWLDSAQTRVESWQTEFRSITESNSGQSTSQDTDIDLGSTFVAQWLVWARYLKSGVSAASVALDQDLRTGLRLALDRTLLGTFRDASPWRSEERPALARTFQRAMANLTANAPSNDLKNASDPLVPLVEVLSLSKQTNDFRGQTVRVRGQPVTNPEAASQNVEGWGRFQYDIIWIRPKDYSQQPICVYSLRTPRGGWPLIKSVNPTATKDSASNSSEGIDIADSPLAEFSGILVKRLAYPSQRGIDVAPVLIVFDVRWMADESDSQAIEPAIPTLKNRTHRWIEPGQQARNLQLLRDVFASDLESLSDEAIQSKLTENDFSLNTATETPQLVQILYQLPRVEKPLMAAIATRQKIGPSTLGSFQGWVREITTIRQSRALTASGEPMTIYRLRIEPHDGQSIPKTSQYAFVNQVPFEWKSLTKVSQPISLSGLYWETSTENGLTRCWIADHVNWSWPWLNDEAVSGEASAGMESLVPSIPIDWKRLGALGFDLGRVELLRSLRGKPIVAQESQPFYSLIHCVNQLTLSEKSSSGPVLSAIDCLQEKNSIVLRRVRTKVHIVRATRIAVSDEYDQAALDGETYYELDGLAKLGDLAIELKSPDGKENIVFEGEYPITLVAKHIPPWLSGTVGPESNSATLESEAIKSSVRAENMQNSTPLVWYPRTTIEIEGVFYRLWSFSTSQTSSMNKSATAAGAEDARMRQIGPLVAVTNWGNRPVDDSSVSKRSVTREMLTAFGVAAICIYGYYRLSQKSKRRKA